MAFRSMTRTLMLKTKSESAKLDSDKVVFDYLLNHIKIAVSDLECVQRTSLGYEISFADVPKLKAAGQAMLKDGTYEVFGDFSQTKVVTVVNAPHELTDEALRGVLNKYGKIVDSRRLKYKDVDVYNGVRQFKMELYEGMNIPSTIQFGSRYVWVRYSGQVKTCLKCQRKGHTSESCDVIRCNRCFQEGHVSRACKNQQFCVICEAEGHLFSQCPNSYVNKAKTQQVTSPLVSTQDLAQEIATTSFESTSKDDEVSQPQSPDLFNTQTSLEAKETENASDSDSESLVIDESQPCATEDTETPKEQPKGKSTGHSGRRSSAPLVNNNGNKQGSGNQKALKKTAENKLSKASTRSVGRKNQAQI